MTLRPFVKLISGPLIAVTFICLGHLPARAQDTHSHVLLPQNAELTADQKSQAKTLLKRVRDATERFQNVEVAEGDGYQLLFGCVSGDSAGAMGLAH